MNSNLLQFVRDTIHYSIRHHDNDEVLNDYNLTHFEPHFYSYMNWPFRSQIFVLNHFVLTTESTNFAWDESTLWLDEGELSILFFVSIDTLQSLWNWCILKGYKIEEQENWNELNLIVSKYNKKNPNCGIDYIDLCTKIRPVLVTSYRKQKDLYIELIEFFSSQYREIQKVEILNEMDNRLLFPVSSVRDMIFYDIDVWRQHIREIYPLIDRMIQKVERVNSKDVYLFYHPFYIDFHKFRVGVSQKIYERLLKKEDIHMIHVEDLPREFMFSERFNTIKPEKQCDHHLLIDIDKGSIEEITNRFLSLFD